MRKVKMAMVAVVAIMALCSSVSAFDIVPSIAANDQFVKGWVGFGDPDGGLIGPYVAWNDQDSKNLWGVGIRGQLDVSAPARQALGTIFGVPQVWWDSLDKVGARVYAFNEIGICRMHGGPEAVASPGLGARLFVLTVEGTYDIFEGGQVRSLAGDPLAESGFQWFIGISRVFRF